MLYDTDYRNAWAPKLKKLEQMIHKKRYLTHMQHSTIPNIQ